MPPKRGPTSHDAYRLNFILNDDSNTPVIKPSNCSDTVDTGSESQSRDQAGKEKVSESSTPVTSSGPHAPTETDQSKECLPSLSTLIQSIPGPSPHALAPNVSDPQGPESTAPAPQHSHTKLPFHPPLPSTLGTEYVPRSPIFTPVATLGNSLDKLRQGTSQFGTISSSPRNHAAALKFNQQAVSKLGQGQNLNGVSQRPFLTLDHAKLIIPPRKKQDDELEEDGTSYSDSEYSSSIELSPTAASSPARKPIKGIIPSASDYLPPVPPPVPPSVPESIPESSQPFSQPPVQLPVQRSGPPKQYYVHEGYNGAANGVDPFQTPPARAPQGPMHQVTPTYSSPRVNAPPHRQYYSPRPGGTPHGGYAGPGFAGPGHTPGSAAPPPQPPLSRFPGYGAVHDTNREYRPASFQPPPYQQPPYQPQSYQPTPLQPSSSYQQPPRQQPTYQQPPYQQPPYQQPVYGYVFPGIQAPQTDMGPPMIYPSPVTPSTRAGTGVFQQEMVPTRLPAIQALQSEQAGYTYHSSPHGEHFGELRPKPKPNPQWREPIVAQEPMKHPGERLMYQRQPPAQSSYHPYAAPARDSTRGSPVRGSTRGSPLRRSPVRRRGRKRS